MKIKIYPKSLAVAAGIKAQACACGPYTHAEVAHTVAGWAAIRAAETMKCTLDPIEIDICRSRRGRVAHRNDLKMTETPLPSVERDGLAATALFHRGFRKSVARRNAAKWIERAEIVGSVDAKEGR